MDRLTSGGEFLDFNQQAAILDQTNLQINRLERYKDYEQMDQTGEITLGLDLYADEASLVDPERKHTLVIRARNRRLKHELEDLFFNTLRWDTHCRPTIRYLSKFGDSPFEVILDANRQGVSALKFMNVYNFTRIETRYGDLVGFFYMDAIFPKPMFLHPWQVMHLRLTSFENIYHPYGRCADIRSRIWGPGGSKIMKDLLPGDEIYSFDGQNIIPTKVVKFVNSGIKKTLLIKTKHRSIRVTDTHPMLAVVKNKYLNTKFGPKRDLTTKQYILAGDLRIGDKLILPLIQSSLVPVSLDSYKIEGHAGKRLQFPEIVTPDFAKLMGFLIGDGWIPSYHPTTLCWAEGEHEDINNKYKKIISNFGYDGEPDRKCKNDKKYGYYNYNSAELARTVAIMGLAGRCWEKRIPKWVFTAPIDIRLAFVEGVIDSDGSTNIDKWGCERFQIELTSEELVKDLKVLLDQTGYKCGNIVKRTRVENTVEFDGVEYERRESWIIYWYDSKMPTGHLAHKGRRRTKYLHDEDGFLVESIISVEEGGEIEVGDIQVDSECHNFIADGVVIHNSVIDGGRKAFKQLRLMEDAALIYRITRAPEKRKFTIPVGMIPSKEVPEYMQMIARNFKRQRFYNPTTGTFDERYSPLIQEDDFFMPRRPDGSGPDVDVLPGAENLDQIKDIEYFKKKMVAPMKIPFARVGIGEGGGEASEKSLSQSHSEFAKAVQWVQREVATGLTKVAIIHLALRGYRVEDLRGFDISLTATSAMEELYRIETWQTRVGVMSDLKELGWFPREWIVTHFTDLSPDEIQELKDMEQVASDGGGGGGPSGPGGVLDLGADEEGGEGEVEGEGEEGGELEDILGTPNAQAGAEPGAPATPIEGFDYSAERRLILELKRQGKTKEAKTIVESWANRLGKPVSKSDIEYTSGFDYVVSSKELDGLSMSEPTNVKSDSIIESIHDPNNDDNLLVKWSVDPNDRNEVIEETYNLLTSEPIIDDIGQDDITSSDLPISSVSDL